MRSAPQLAGGGGYTTPAAASRPASYRAPPASAALPRALPVQSAHSCWRSRLLHPTPAMKPLYKAAPVFIPHRGPRPTYQQLNKQLDLTQRQEHAAVQLVLARELAGARHESAKALMANEAAQRRAGWTPMQVDSIPIAASHRSLASADDKVSHLQSQLVALRSDLRAPDSEDRAEERAAAQRVAKSRTERHAASQAAAAEVLAAIDARWEDEQRQLAEREVEKAAERAALAQAAFDEEERVRAGAEAAEAAAEAERAAVKAAKAANARKAAAAYLLKANRLSKMFVGSRTIETRNPEEQRRDARVQKIMLKLKTSRAASLAGRLLDALKARGEGGAHAASHDDAQRCDEAVHRVSSLLDGLGEASEASVGEASDPQPLLLACLDVATSGLLPKDEATRRLAGAIEAALRPPRRPEDDENHAASKVQAVQRGRMERRRLLNNGPPKKKRTQMGGKYRSRDRMLERS